MQYYIAHEKKEIAVLKKELRKNRNHPDQNVPGKIACLIEEKEAALILVNATIAAANRLNGALNV